MLSQDEKLNLAGLPSDIIRKIIRTEIESIERMKLISQTWHSLALEHNFGVNRSNLPMMEQFCWKMDQYEDHFLRLKVSEEYRNYFGVENWNQVRTDPEITEIQLVTYPRPGFKKFLERKNRILDRIMRHLNRCSCIKSLELPFNQNRNSDANKVMQSAFKGVIIESLIIKEIHQLEKDSKSNILDFLRENNVRCIIFPNFNASIKRDHSFIIKSLPLVPQTELKLDPRNTNLRQIGVSRYYLMELQRNLNSTEPVKAILHEVKESNGCISFRITVKAR